MACENCSDDLRSATRHHNRALRSVNKSLRRKIERVGQSADDLFNALCETDTKARLAFGELWGNALFDCGPEDYDYMVEEIIKKFKLVQSQTSEQTQ